MVSDGVFFFCHSYTGKNIGKHSTNWARIVNIRRRWPGADCRQAARVIFAIFNLPLKLKLWLRPRLKWEDWGLIIPINCTNFGKVFLFSSCSHVYGAGLYKLTNFKAWRCSDFIYIYIRVVLTLPGGERRQGLLCVSLTETQWRCGIHRSISISVIFQTKSIFSFPWSNALTVFNPDQVIPQDNVIHLSLESI